MGIKVKVMLDRESPCTWLLMATRGGGRCPRTKSNTVKEKYKDIAENTGAFYSFANVYKSILEIR